MADLPLSLSIYIMRTIDYSCVFSTNLIVHKTACEGMCVSYVRST